LHRDGAGEGWFPVEQKAARPKCGRPGFLFEPARYLLRINVLNANSKVN
jgi:hypothetical protein